MRHSPAFAVLRPAFAALFGFALLVGLLGACAGQPEEGRKCVGDFATLLACLPDGLAKGPVTLTLDPGTGYQGSELNRRLAERQVWEHRDQLAVEVPKGVRTGEGGTVLLVLAGHRRVARNARIDGLGTESRNDLGNLGICDEGKEKESCDAVASGAQGGDLIDQGLADDLYSNSRTPLLLSIGGVLVVLLAAFVYLVRRSGGPGTPQGRPLAAAGIGAVPPQHPNGYDEPTTPLRSYGRTVGPRTGPARTAVVRTGLHPQGYVELDRVLYRAVWAEPHRPPPGPGGLVDVTESRGEGHIPDVLYAYPSAQSAQSARRHVK
ncbi:hypothetical protein OK074_6517 [Actinobacteria bacterium OK074]|nr:hypothetical protein OK074_6517 [Actinobacteria bacterium OK074]